MLVYLKEPMGASTVGGHRVYGKYFSYGKFGATDIPRSIYLKNKDILEEAEYTPRWLSKKFNCDFPNITFKISELKKFPFETQIEIAKCMGINYIVSPNKSNEYDRKALRRAIANVLK